MTYRNDHDAALARVDALEAENARLQRELDALRTPAMPEPAPEPEPEPERAPAPAARNRGLLATALVASLIGGGGLISLAMTGQRSRPTREPSAFPPLQFSSVHHEADDETDHQKATVRPKPDYAGTDSEPASRTAVRDCIAGLVLNPPDADAANTDPHRPRPTSIAPVLASTGCSAVLKADLASGTVPERERVKLQILSAKEERLELTVQAIHGYYANDPYLIDNYVGASGLWARYGHALIERNYALREWRDSTL